jgi:prolyl oligopeptidase
MRLAILISLCFSFVIAFAQVPPTPQRPVTDSYFGTEVVDPWRWLEDSTSSEAQAWFIAQGAYARAQLDALPTRADFLKRVRELAASAPPELSLPREAGGSWFYTVSRPDEVVPKAYVRNGWTGKERLLVDPAAIEGTGARGSNALGALSPSPDGRLLLYGITSGGSEEEVLRVRDVASGNDLDEIIPRSRWAVTSWMPDGRSFLYLQLRELPDGAPAVDFFRNVSIRHHRLGRPTNEDPVVFSAAMVGADAMLLPESVDVYAAAGVMIARLGSGVEEKGRYYLTTISQLEAGTPVWREIFTLEDQVESLIVHGTSVYFLTRQSAPMGRIMRTPLDAPALANAEVVLPETAQNLVGMQAALDGLYVKAFREGAVGLKRIAWGAAAVDVTLPAGSSIWELAANPAQAGALLELGSWTSRAVVYRYSPSTDVIEDMGLRPLGPNDRLADYISETVMAVSHDGVKVPLSIIRPNSMPRDGSTQFIMFGYGSYGTTDEPVFIPEFRAWSDGIRATATCHVRGGGFYGEAWHLAGKKATKPNTWLDFIACAEYLTREGYTRPERLAVSGTSAGGILIGRAITERPELFAAALISVGLSDSLRAETTGNGPPNVPEFGSVGTEEGFRALHAMSPLHHVEKGVSYPAVLLSTGLNDPRVDPWQPGKMAAALQDATRSGKPILLRVDSEAGHASGGTTDRWQANLADMLSFVDAHTRGITAKGK